MRGLTSAFLLAAAAVSTTSARPHPQTETTGGPPNYPYASNTSIIYYQGSAGTWGVTDPALCPAPVAKGSIQSSVCKTLYTSAIGLKHVHNSDCSFTLFSGSSSCDAGNKKVVALPRGNATTCLGTGVLDGGRFQHSSGIFTCG